MQEEEEEEEGGRGWKEERRREGLLDIASETCTICSHRIEAILMPRDSVILVEMSSRVVVGKL